MNKSKKLANIITFLCVFLSAFLQSFVIKAFIQPANFLSSGFTGIALLADSIAGLFGKSVSISLMMLILNIPVAIICYKAISKRFVIFSVIQVILGSLFLKIFQFKPVFGADEEILNAIFGGFLLGISIVVALKGRASTGGTDFIALYVSNKKGKSIWNQIFFFNLILICIFGFIFGWNLAGYSILFQFIATKTISTFHQRYVRVTLQITTSKPDEIIQEYVNNFRHGLSCTKSMGGYSKKELSLIHTVVSSYEVQDIVEHLKLVDPYIIINVFKTEEFYGRFYQEPLG